MSYIPSSSQLRGLSLAVAELYGKPHIGAHYCGKSVRSHKWNDGSVCLICGKPVQNVHHVPPLSKGHKFIMNTPNGVYELMPSLFALCGSGTTGCHNDFHGGARFFPEWVWNTDSDAEDWWTGEIFKFAKPHSSMLYAFGCWRIHDRFTDKYIEVKK